MGGVALLGATSEGSGDKALAVSFAVNTPTASSPVTMPVRNKEMEGCEIFFAIETLYGEF
jgi:hypothetical protein